MSGAGMRNICKLAVLFLLFCASPAAAKSYRSVLNTWTKHREYFSATTLRPKIIWNATFFSPEYRRAHNTKHLKIKYLKGAEAAAYVAREEGRQAAGYEFFIALYAPKPYRHFTAEKDSFWEAVLTTADGRMLKPVTVEMRVITPLEEVMYPYVNRWMQGYRVVFPKEDLGKEFTLTLRSVIGQTHLEW